jgi:hypothetical protein
MYSSDSVLTSALDEVRGRALTPGKGHRYPLNRRLGGSQELVWTQKLWEKSFVAAGDRTPVIQSSQTILTELPQLL